jgi:YkoY family integral membrane protein
MFGQTFDARDLFVIGLLIVLEGVLSIDNALVLGLLAKRLPKPLQGKALTYGLVGAFVFRIIAIATASYLLRWRVVKLLGGAYLIYVSVKHFFFDADVPDRQEVTLGPDGMPVVKETANAPADAGQREAAIAAREPAAVGLADAALGDRRRAGFWSTVAVIELTDIAFAIDSILAAIALVGSPPAGTPKDATHPKLWVVITGGMLGVILMRFAAFLFIRLLEKFPRFETSAYLLVIVIGLKLVADWAFNSAEHPHRIDFHDFRGPEFWVFWLLMIASFCLGFLPKGRGGPGGGGAGGTGGPERVASGSGDADKRVSAAPGTVRS